MANQLCVTEAKRTPTRKLSFLPRIGIYVNVAGKQFVYKQAPMAETLLNLYERGFSMANLMAVATEQFREIEFPEIQLLHQDSRKKKVAKPVAARSKKRSRSG